MSRACSGWIINDTTDIGVAIRSWATLGTNNVGWKVYLKEPTQFTDMTNRYDPK